MTERIDVKITADGSGLIRAGKDAEKAVKQLGSTVQSQGTATRNAFSGLSGEASKLGAALSGVSGRFNASTMISESSRARNSLRDIEAEAKRVGDALTAALSPKASIPKITATVGGGAGGAGAGATAAATATATFGGVLTNITRISGSATAEVMGLDAGFNKLGKTIQETSGISAGQAASTAIQVYSTLAFRDAILAQAQAQQKATDEAMKAISTSGQRQAAEMNLTAAIGNRAEAERLLTEATEKRRAAEAAHEMLARGMTDAAEDHTASLAYQQVKINQLRDAEIALMARMQEAEAQYSKAVAAVDALKSSTDGATRSTDEQKVALSGLKDSLTQALGPIGSMVQGFVDLGKNLLTFAGSIQNVGLRFAAFGAIGVTAIVAVTKAIGAMADAWANSDMAKQLIEAEMAATGMAAAFTGVEGSVGPVVGVIDQLAAASKKFDSDAIMAAATQLRLMGGTEEQIVALLPALTSIAESMNIDVAEAAQKVTFGLEGSTKGLKAMGIVVGDGATKMEIYNAVLARGVIAAKQVALQQDGTIAATNRLKKAGEELSEAWGNIWDGPLNALTNFVAASEELLTSFLSKFGGGKSVIDLIGTGGAKATGDGLTGEKNKKKDDEERKRREKEDERARKRAEAAAKAAAAKDAKASITVTESPKAFQPEFLKNLEARVDTLFSAGSLDNLGKQLLAMPLSLETMKKAIEIVGKRFTTLAAEEEQFKLDNIKRESDNAAFALKKAQETAQLFEDGLKKAAEKLDELANVTAQAVNTVTDAAGSLARGDIRGAVGTGISAVGEFGGPLGKMVSAVLGAVQTAFVIGDEQEQKNREREAANQELFRQNLEKFGISVETMGDTQKDLAVKLGLKTAGQASLEKARGAAAGALQAGGLGELAGVAATLNEAQANEVAKLVANGDLEGAANLLYGIAGKERPAEMFRPAVPQAYSDYGITVPDQPTGRAQPLSGTQEATLTTFANIIIDGFKALLPGAEGITPPGQVPGSDPKTPLYVFDVTPQEEQFMFAPRSYFFRAAAEARAVM